MRAVLHAFCAVGQFLAGWFTPLLGVAALRWFVKAPLDMDGRPEPPTVGWGRVGRTTLLGLLAGVLQLPFVAVGMGITFGVTALSQNALFGNLVGIGVEVVLLVAGYCVVAWQGTDTPADLRAFGVAVRIRMAIVRFLGTLCVLGLSLLPLSALLLAYPAVNPQESVLTDAVPARRSFLRSLPRRLFALLAGLIVLLTLLVVSVEAVTRITSDRNTQRLLPERGSFRAVSRMFLFAPNDVKMPARPPEEAKKAPSADPLSEEEEKKQEDERRAAQAEREAKDKAAEKEAKDKLAAMPKYWRDLITTPLADQLPPAMVEHWQFVILGVYLLDVGVLLLIGRVPLAYNLRNLRVRWKTNAMTAFAFACVIGLLSFLLAFVNGMNKLTETSGIKGNVFVLSDGATDEVFSNLGYGDLGNVERVRADEEQVFDGNDKPVKGPDGQDVWKAVPPVVIKSERAANGETVYWSNRETYYSVNMAVPNSERRRFVQLRTHENADIAAKVHDVKLVGDGRWFSTVGVDDQSRIECVIGAGIAKTLAEDVKKPTLTRGDTFEMGDMTWVVAGVMQSEGTTFGSEIWAKKFDRITKPFGKEKYTTLVMRTEQDTKEASRAFANFLNKKYTQEKLKAFSEPDYYAELTKTNNTFLICVLVVCIVMAVGGVFGMMTTMFASIAQRIRDIGVLRLLGFKRWQVMVSFLLESLAVAVIGGAAGIALAWLLADGKSATSTISGGGGGPGGKTVALTINVDGQVMALALLFTLVMGRLGGLVPAMSAMRMKILDSLR